jgi:hypothetical protein
MKGFTVRLATAEDTELFAEWVASNPDIPTEDYKSLEYPTTITIVVEKEGQPIFFMPLYLSLNISFLGFKPDLTPKEKSIALQEMQRALINLGTGLGIRESHVFTKAEYPMGKWALKHDFVEREKDAFVLDLSKKGDKMR